MRCVGLVSALVGLLQIAAAGAEKVFDVIEVAPVWSGHPVGFSLLTHGSRQFVAFYDTNRQMTVASRALFERTWQFHRLPSTIGWDSHNSVTMAVDADGHLHVSGNMHVTPLTYFRTTRAGDISSLERVPAMVGDREKQVTYPQFLTTPSGDLAFMYRDGRSGGGDTILNIYNRGGRAWRRGLNAPLFSGGGKMNAYPVGPVQGPDGYMHIVWVWRDTPDCASNHDLSYARTRDLVRWETSKGKPITLPVTLRTGDVVDPIPAGGGLINGNTRIGFDAAKRPIISYHKHDAAGNTQIYCARLERGQWKQYQVSDWKYRWDFSGGGTINFEIRVGPVEVNEDKELTLSYSHAKYRSGTWKLDPKTLKPTGNVPVSNPVVEYARKFAGTFPGLQNRSATDLGQGSEAGVRYALIWQTLPANRDRAPEGPLPPPSMLRLLKTAPDSQ